MTIDILPDDVLVEIFFYVNIKIMPDLRHPWRVLVRMCRRWRYIVFASPRRLNLRLEYEEHRPMSEALGPWPVLPAILISIMGDLHSGLPNPKSDQQWDNVVAALKSEHYGRIHGIQIISMTNSHLERLAAAMQKPFPELTHLELLVVSEVVPVLPDSCLGGSAPRLQTLSLDGVPFPSIPKLLLSANGLVTLSLLDISHSGYFSPDAMGTALTVMTKLESLELRFCSPQSRPDSASRPLPSHTRFVLPVLSRLTFEGVYEYLDLLARIHAPLLDYLHITSSMDLNSDVPQLQRLIGHSEEFKAFNYAGVVISGHLIQLNLYPKSRAVYHSQMLMLDIDCGDWQLSSLARGSSFPLTSALEELKIICRCTGKTTWRTLNGWNFSVRSLLRRISIF